MKTIIKLLLAAAIVNAVVRIGAVAMDYYRFKDAAQQVISFSGDATPEQLHDRILEKAMQLDVPLAPDDLTVRRDGPLIVAAANYTQPVELFPRYRYPMSFSFSVDSRAFDTASAGVIPQKK